MAAHSTKQTRFKLWLTANKAQFPKLEFRDDVEGCGSVYCSSDIADDEVFLVIPFEPLVLTEPVARKSLPACVDSLSGRIAITLFLVQQSLLKEESFFHPYLDMIPERIHTALEFDDQDMEYLRGTNAFLTVQELMATLRKSYEDTMAVVGKDLDPKQYTWERFLWAETVISSRAFPAHLFGGGINGELVLIPLGDTLNHKSRHKATWIKTPQGLEMSSGVVHKGDQVFNNYGPKSNEELLIGYGFCTEDNADDMVTLKTNFTRDPDQDRKKSILKRLNITDETKHYLHHGDIPRQLLVTMRVMAMNPAEADYYHALLQSQQADLQTELDFVSLRNEMAMLDLLDLLLGAKLSGVLEWDQKLSPATNQGQEFALIYRQGQRQILESCTALCRGMFTVLLRESTTSHPCMERAAFIGSQAGQRRVEPMETYTTSYFQKAADQEVKTISELKREAAQRVLLTAERIMIDQKEGLFGEALSSAFPDHGWGEVQGFEGLDEEEEMTMQLEQDAIVTCFLIFGGGQPTDCSKFLQAAKMFDYSGQLDEDMVEDVEDLRLSLQETLQEVDPEVFDFESTFTSDAFRWATGIMEALSLSFHINGELVTGVLALRD